MSGSSSMHDDDATFNPFMNEPDAGSSSRPQGETSSPSLAFAVAERAPITEAQQETQQEAVQIPLPPDQTQQLLDNQPQPAAQAPRRATRLTLRDNLDWKDEIKIIDAQKTSEGSSTTYITYIIRSDQGDARRRYSEFESLREVLSKLYPVLILPPIPPHHSITDYASKQSKAKEDANVIARRKRMLQIFLNRLARHPIFSEERVFQRFLEPNLPWSEVLHAPPVTLLPKNILKASARTPADPATSALYSSLPGPSGTSASGGSSSGYGPQLQEPDQRFLDSELFTNKFSAHLSGSMEKINRRTMKRWSELSADYAELGAVMNGFSLNEGSSSSGSAIANLQGEQERQAADSLARAVESTGQAIDSTYLGANAMLQDWERTFTEPLAEYTQFSSVIKQLLKYRHNKHLQFEMTRDSLESKKGTLEELERSEMEARRLDQALDRALTRGRAGERAEDTASQQPSSEGGSDVGSSQLRRSQSASTSAGGGKFGFLGALSHTLNGIVDSDPDMTRRNNIGKTREQINQFESSIQSVTADLRYANQMIQADLDRFQRQKVGDLRQMCMDYSSFHIEMSKKNLDLWRQARKIIEEIDDAPASINTPSAATGFNTDAR